YVRLHFEDQKPMILKSLNSLEERLDPKIFFRANRKHIINLNWIDKIEPWFSGGLLVTLKGGDKATPLEKIEISRRQSIKFKDLISLCSAQPAFNQSHKFLYVLGSEMPVVFGAVSSFQLFPGLIKVAALFHLAKRWFKAVEVSAKEGV